MIIFTVTNTVTNQVYVGSTRSDLEAQWEKMVAAAEQNMDYPLYRDIRTHGVEAFQREIYDMAETRDELAEIENDALEMLDAISLRGHKTSNVIIQKRKPVRRKKSDAEKELLALLDGFAESSDDEDMTEEAKQKSALTPKPASEEENRGRVIKAAELAQPTKQNSAPAQQPARSEKEKSDAFAAAKAILAEAAREQQEKEKAKAKEVAAEQQKRASRTSGTVKLDLSLDSSIDDQLAALTAAIDDVLAGNTQAADSLDNKTFQVKTAHTEVAEQQASIAQPESTEEQAAPAQEEITEEVVIPKRSAREIRIIAAIERHREQRAKRTSAAMDEEKQQLQGMLAELNNRIALMPGSTPHLYH